MSKQETVLKVTLEFNKQDVERILKGVNEFMFKDNPITVEEVTDSPKLRQCLEKELKLSKEEIVEGSYEATANDWLDDIGYYRKAKYRNK